MQKGIIKRTSSGLPLHILYWACAWVLSLSVCVVCVISWAENTNLQCGWCEGEHRHRRIEQSRATKGCTPKLTEKEKTIHRFDDRMHFVFCRFFAVCVCLCSVRQFRYFTARNICHKGECHTKRNVPLLNGDKRQQSRQKKCQRRAAFYFHSEHFGENGFNRCFFGIFKPTLVAFV